MQAVFLLTMKAFNRFFNFTSEVLTSTFANKSGLFEDKHGIVRSTPPPPPEESQHWHTIPTLPDSCGPSSSPSAGQKRPPQPWDMARQEQVLVLEPQHELRFRGKGPDTQEPARRLPTIGVNTSVYTCVCRLRGCFLNRWASENEGFW